MSELLTAKDIEVKVFKKVRFGGYSVTEVEDFLNQVADDLDFYAEELEEKNKRIEELEAHVDKQDAVNDDIREALLMVRQTAKKTEEQTKSETDKIIAEARAQAERIIAEAEEKAQQRLDEAGRADEIVSAARVQSDEILSSARSEARKLMDSAKSESHDYSEQLRYLNLKKQQFLKDTMSLLLDFGKTIEDAQQDIDAELRELQAPEDVGEYPEDVPVEG